MRKNLYLIFDKIPDPSWGGLFTMYQNLIELLHDDYKINIISIFNNQYNINSYYKNIKIITILKKDIDIRFYRGISYLKKKKFVMFLKAIYSAIFYFVASFFTKMKIKKIIDGPVIVSAPSAAIFMPNIPFILEIHTKYEYFFGNNLIGRLQTKLMTKPALILFRTEADSLKMKDIPSSFIYNFFNDEEIEKFNFDLNIKKNKIIWLGRLNKEKNPFRVLEIALLLAEKRKDFKIDIYGAGNLDQYLESEIKRLNLENHVSLKGYVDNKSIYQKYSLLLNTSNAEGFPITFLEAKANGIPIISSVWGEGVFECINTDKDGYYVETNEEFVDKIFKVLDNDELLYDLSISSLKSFEKFSRKNAKIKWLYFIDKVFG